MAIRPEYENTLLPDNGGWDFFLTESDAGLIHIIDARKRSDTHAIDLQTVHLGTLNFNGHTHQNNFGAQGLGIL
jgi:hypothetical protein